MSGWNTKALGMLRTENAKLRTRVEELETAIRDMRSAEILIADKTKPTPERQTGHVQGEAVTSCDQSVDNDDQHNHDGRSLNAGES